MINNLSTRITALERKTAKTPKIFSIICKGATPTPEEQEQIDDAEKRGEFAVCRLIVTPKNHYI
ncbi:hypothetical protein SCD_n01189 [Sulfuricella denitrificans skB26]|uniref:Uncharacterized protein n=1 Tax=Sulfuricella denitrificans (strain DSM 22764 / NBRC 105220 / skB26) TaxID=1163617 RepID=S6ABU6_SULDS|nr:hypothetical protein [Sulfuricella denitrificans]BAN35018.1 hypothetical protein SCD_n01189 [Sulfuricella denitrificans skB26]